MSTANLTNVDNILMREYFPGIERLVLQTKQVFSKFEKKTKKVGGGQGFFVSLETAPNFSASAAPMVGGTWNTAGIPTYAQISVRAKMLQCVGQIENAVVKNAHTDKQAVIDALDGQTESATNAMIDLQGRQAFGDGLGTMAYVVDAGGGPTTTVTFTRAQHYRPFVNGQIISVLTATEAVDVTATVRTISSVTYTSDTAGTFVISGAAIAQTTGNRIVTQNAVAVDGGSNVTGTKTNELAGLSAIIGDGLTSIAGITYGLETYLGVSATSQPLWKSAVVDGGNVTADSSMLRNAISQVAVVSSDKPTDIISHEFVRNGYADNLEANKLFFDDKLSGGYSSLTYLNNGSPMQWTVDKWATPNEIYLPCMPKIYLGVTAGLDFEKGSSGGVLIDAPDRSMSKEFRLSWYGQFVCQKRSASARIVRVANAS